ncbi:diacylglycerol kinase family protein [Bacillus salitolerans]|uniref:Diacylglycerol kinase family protein n=1 Tax=Bacillus salitolerans TaxID=1437434 RepID=A0ABW4LNG6_9BACI
MRREFTRLKNSFRFAIEGVIHAYKTEKNIRIHTVVAVLTLALAWFLDLERWEWSLIIMLIGGMLSLELLNSAIERAVNLVTNEYHPLAKQAKDLAAGAVFVFAIVSVLIGIIIIGQKIWINILNFLTI